MKFLLSLILSLLISGQSWAATLTANNIPMVQTGGSSPLLQNSDVTDSLGSSVSVDTVIKSDQIQHLDGTPKIIDVKDPACGAKGNGTTDDTSAIQACVTANYGNIIFFPAGTYLVSSNITITNNIEIFGNYGAAIETNSGTADVFTITTNNPVEIHDISIYSGVSRSAGAAISIAGADGSHINNYSRFANINFGGGSHPFYEYLNFTGAGYFSVSKCIFNGGTYAISIANAVNSGSGDNYIEGNTFSNGLVSNVVAIYNLSGSGLRIIGNKVIGYQYAYEMNLQLTGGSLNIVGNSFEGQGNDCINFTQGVSGKTFQGVTINDNELQSTNTYINITAGAQVWLQNVTITGNSGNGGLSATPSYGITAQGVSGGIISGNYLIGNTNAGSVGVSVGGNSTLVDYSEANELYNWSTSETGTNTWGNYYASSTVSGFSSLSTKYIYTSKIGNKVYVDYALVGTSNASSITFTLPYTANANPGGYTWPTISITNGTQTTGLLILTAGSATATCYPTAAGGNWTNGSSTCEGGFWYQSS